MGGEHDQLSEEQQEQLQEVLSHIEIEKIHKLILPPHVHVDKQAATAMEVVAEAVQVVAASD